MQHKRKTISGQDVLDAMKEMEFERFVEPLKRSLEGTYWVSMMIADAVEYWLSNIELYDVSLSATKWS